MNTQTKRPLEGIVPPLITPLAGRDELDVPGLERLIEHVLAGGVHGLFILGTSGEAPSLSYRLRRELITRTCRQVRGRVPVLVGITDTSIVEALSVARHAAEAGARALVTSAPYYLPVNQSELMTFVRHLVRALPLPLYLYNMPQMTKVQFDPETVRRLTDEDGIIGVKDSSGDLDYFRRLIEAARERPDWRLFVGPEQQLVEVLRLGGHGGVNGGALIDPTLLVNLYQAAKDGNEPRVAHLQARLLNLGRLYLDVRRSAMVIKGMKCALSLMGLCNDMPAEPLERLSPAEQEGIRRTLDELGLLHRTQPELAEVLA